MRSFGVPMVATLILAPSFTGFAVLLVGELLSFLVVIKSLGSEAIRRSRPECLEIPPAGVLSCRCGEAWARHEAPCVRRMGDPVSDQPHRFAMLGQEPVATIDREELKTKLDNGESIKLVMALNRWAFDAKHILGSLHFDDPDDLYSALHKDEEIIVYCSNVDCLSSVALYRALVSRGYRKVRRYAGGLLDWEEAGFPLEGTSA
jgi:rhodanese-related sulfurtransferase